jgi:hypothetical protein
MLQGYLMEPSSELLESARFTCKCTTIHQDAIHAECFFFQGLKIWRFQT